MYPRREQQRSQKPKQFPLFRDWVSAESIILIKIKKGTTRFHYSLVSFTERDGHKDEKYRLLTNWI